MQTCASATITSRSIRLRTLACHAMRVLRGRGSSIGSTTQPAHPPARGRHLAAAQPARRHSGGSHPGSRPRPSRVATPAADIDPIFVGAVAVCREMQLGNGRVDNFLVTPSGLPVLVECKLWRNPEARREVVGPDPRVRQGAQPMELRRHSARGGGAHEERADPPCSTWCEPPIRRWTRPPSTTL